MNKILAMREKRGEVWDKAKAFLNEHQDENGMLSPEDAAQMGNIVASITIQQIGVTGFATPEQVVRRFEEYCM